MTENHAGKRVSTGINTLLTSDHVVEDLISKLQNGNSQDAADLYSNCQQDLGYQIIEKVKSQPQLFKLIANMFYRARDFEKAALCCEDLGEYDKAALLYEQNDDFKKAAAMYSQVGNHEKAAEMFEQNQQYKQAAELYLAVKNFSKAALNLEKNQNYFDAAKLYHQLGNSSKALELLQNIQSEHKKFISANLLIADIFAKNNRVDLAINQLFCLTEGLPINQENKDSYYQLANYYKQIGNVDTARGLYHQIHKFDPNFIENMEQLEELESTSKSASKSPPSHLDLPSQDPQVEKHPPPQIVTLMDGFDFLRKVPLFEDLPLFEMKALYHICQQRSFQDGERIIEQGEPGKALYVIRSGKALVQRIEHGQTKNVAVLDRGDHFGEMSLIDDSPTSARVVAGDQVMAFEISRDRFLRFLEINQRLAVKVLRVFISTLCQRLRDTTAKLTVQ